MNHLSKLFKGKTSITGRINKKYPYDILRHYDNDLMHLSDERLTELVEENSRQISEERYKAEAWDILKGRIEDSSDIPDKETILEAMQDIYKEVEEDDRL